ncbi:MAG: hypothetical protein AAF416_21860 [Pseudomonadota bacterium]
MTKAPAKTCPSLYQLIDRTELKLLNAFLRQEEFGRLSWLERYRNEAARNESSTPLFEMLQAEPKPRLDPLEKEASRILQIVEKRGQFALDGLVTAKLRANDKETFRRQRDDHARSLWTYLNHRLLFEAAESALHLKLYRHYGRHYQAFKAASDGGRPSVSVDEALQKLTSDIEARLDQGTGCTVERFDLPAQGEHPASEMFILYYPDSLRSEREVREDGERRTIYFRPPGDATIVYTPATGTIEVRTQARAMRRIVADAFAETVLGQDLSNCPLDHREYDLSRFFGSFSLECPVTDGATIKRAQVIKAEVSLRQLRTRLSMTTTIDDDLDEILEDRKGLRQAFASAIGIRFIEIAVRYVPRGETTEKILDFTISDQNSCSLLSLPDEQERVLGHRLLRHWGILREFRELKADEARDLLPVFLELWDAGFDRIPGSWLKARGISPELMTTTGFLKPIGWEEADLIDDGDGELLDAPIIADGPRAAFVPSAGQGQDAGDSGHYRLFRVDHDWLLEKLRVSASASLDRPLVETLTPDLLSLGRLKVEGGDAPVFLARRLTEEKVLAASDVALRARGDQGLGIVLSAGRVGYRCLGANVVRPLADHLAGEAGEPLLEPETVRRAFQSDRHLARGGQSVELAWDGGETGELFVPGKGSIQIPGHERLIVLDRLVKAYKRGAPVMKKGALTAGTQMSDASLKNVFGADLWGRLEGRFVRSAGHGFWEIAA